MTKITEQAEVVKIRLGSTEKEELERIAEAESRTFAGQCRHALREWLETKSAVHGARAAADTTEAATTAANTRSPKRAKPRIGRA